jgi:hypothetical protein
MPTEDFRLKDPNTDPFFKDKPAQKAACKFFLDCINEGRVGEEKVKHRFEVPLIRGDF